MSNGDDRCCHVLVSMWVIFLKCIIDKGIIIQYEDLFKFWTRQLCVAWLYFVCFQMFLRSFQRFIANVESLAKQFSEKKTIGFWKYCLPWMCKRKRSTQYWIWEKLLSSIDYFLIK